MDTGNIDLKSKFDIRDVRLFLSGQLVKSKREITWKLGLMYDGSLGSLFIRESGIMVGVPELSGHVFIGRTKEGVSLSKVMSGYAVEMPERYMASDPIPILADGIKWLGYLPKQKIIWNIGIYTDWLSRSQSFATYSWQFASRVGWVPIKSEDGKTNLHMAFNFRLGQPDNDKIRLRSRPEANPAPFFIDTGEFNSNQSTYTGGEIYFKKGSFLFGTEYFWDKFRAPGNSSYLFQGGEVMLSYIFTGQSRPYTTVGGIYTFVPVTKSVFKGGAGTWEAVVRFSTLELNAGPISGGRMTRISPMINWYMSNNLRFELAYGYGILERFNTRGITHILQSRIQFMIR